MTASVVNTILPLADYASAEVSLYVAQLEDLTRRLREDVADATAAELEWQPAPGANTIGMLLAHIAITEVYWTSTLLERAFLCERVLGIGADDDGMPLPEGATPPAQLAGKPLPWYFDLLLKARAHTTANVMPLTSADLVREIEQRRARGTRTLNGHWILYHMVEHFAGHYGQLNLRHLWRTSARAAASDRA